MKWPFIRFWLIKRPLAVQDPSALHRSETCFGKPVRPPPKRQNDGSERKGHPQRQNSGARRRRGFAMAVAEASAVAAQNNFPGDGRSFRDSHGKPAPSLACAPLFWRWGLARRASRNNFPVDGQSFCDSLPRARFRRCGAGGWPDGLPKTSFRAEGSWNASGRNGRFINQKRTSCQIFKFGLRIADFILSRIRSLSAAKPGHFYQGLAECYFIKAGQPQWPFIKADCSFIKAGQPRLRTRPVAAMAVLSIRSVQIASL